MAAKTGTYTLISSNTLGSSTTTVTFSSIPQTYTDLVLVMMARGTGAGTDRDIYMRFNSDSASNYSRTRLYGNGSSALSTRESSVAQITIGNMPASSASSSEFNTAIININDYSNTTTYKTALLRENTNGSWGGTVFAIVGLWRNTAALTSVSFTPDSGDFSSGSTFKLYGIEAAK
jgi:hypothetical protein